jgi:hypothetical protein
MSNIERGNLAGTSLAPGPLLGAPEPLKIPAPGGESTSIPVTLWQAPSLSLVRIQTIPVPAQPS